MENLTNCRWVLYIVFIISIASCDTNNTAFQGDIVSKNKQDDLFRTVMLKHLQAVGERDSITLLSTMSPKGNMELIQPSAEIVYTVSGFMDFHQAWFDVPNWTIETKIISTDIGERIGVATTEFLYKEPDRDGKPYFNRLIVSYTLEKINNNWYIIKDHASSIEKSTD